MRRPGRPRRANDPSFFEFVRLGWLLGASWVSWGPRGGKDNPQSPQEAAQEPRRDPQDTLRTPLRTPEDIENRPKIKRKPYRKHSKIILKHLESRCGFQCLFADFRRQGEALKSSFQSRSSFKSILNTRHGGGIGAQPLG